MRSLLLLEAETFMIFLTYKVFPPQDSRNFLRSPPSGVQFQFDFEQMFPVAMATLKEDDNLNKMRFKLVPTK